MRLRTPWILAAFRLAHLDYDIVTTLRANNDRFSFDGKTGVLQREPGGPALLRLRRAGGLALTERSYVVTDPSTDQRLAAFEAEGTDWAVVDRFDRRIARVEEAERRHRYCRYRLQVQGAEACRFTWGVPGLSVGTAQMTVEFPSGMETGFDRGLALAFAPILEARARYTSQRLSG